MNFFKSSWYYLGSIWKLLRGVKDPWKLIPLFLRSKHDQLRLLELPKAKLKMWVRGRMDAWSVKEAMLDRFYERYGTRIQSGWTIVDVGAAIGEFTVLAAQENPQGNVYAVEPNSQSIELLKRNLQVNGLSNVVIIQKGLWRESSVQTLNLINQEPLQAMTQNPGQTDHEQMQFETQTLGDFISEYHLKQIDLLKSDCEGAEYDFLLTCSDDVLRVVQRIVMEYHDLDELRNHQVLEQFLIANGYHVKLVPNQVHSNIGYLYAERMSLE